MNLVVWDIESSGASTDWSSIIEIGGVLVDENLKEIDRFNLRCSLPEGEIFQAMALIVNKTSIKQLTQTNLSHYQMLGEVEKIFKKWSPAIFLGWSSIGFDEELIRKEFFKGIRYPYISSAAPNMRHDGINIARAAYAVDSSILQTEINAKNNVVFKLESLARMQGIDTSDAHSALADAELTAKILRIIKKKQEHTWNSFLKTANKSDTETIIKKGEIITLNEYYYGKSRLHLVVPLHPKHCVHPIYHGWYYSVDLRTDVEPLLNLSINELKNEMKKTPKFLRTIRANKAPIIFGAEFGMKAEPYNAMDSNLIKKRAHIVQNNEKFSQNILTALREIAEEKEQSKSQEDIYAEESIYTKFTSNKDTALFPAWHAASWKDKLKLLDKFDDDRLIGFGKKIIYQEAPEILPQAMYKSIKREIAKRILSERYEKWWTIPTLFTEIDTLREKYTNENDQKKLELLDEFNNYAMSIQKKYENS
tara:strand:- start:74 stop:1507 length:1434 start_codon:yes stop_codon:yes gene_type:complete